MTASVRVLTTRRSFLTRAINSVIASAGAVLQCRADEARPRANGNRASASKAFDELMTAFIEQNQVPGAALAISQQGELIYTRGFGFADRETRQPVQAESLFRIASVSKPITAVAVLQLVERGILGLDDPILGRMKFQISKSDAGKLDPRWRRITIRHCLQHTGGWDRTESFDPIATPHRISESLGIPYPIHPDDIIRFMMGRPLDFEPGDHEVYSNFGYLILGRIIEKNSGQTYEQYVQEHVFRPIGVVGPQLGRVFYRDRAPGEVRYYDSKQRTVPSVNPPSVGKNVPIQYGGENFEAFGAHGGWIASAVDLVKFASAFDRPGQSPLLKEQTIADMWSRPPGRAGEDRSGMPRDVYYGMGWQVRENARGSFNQWHNGLIAGSGALLVRRHDNINWSVLFNTQANPAGEILTNLIDPLLHQTANRSLLPH
ncbi:serine hydrolase domain-containing protein [Planctomicrobium sp. SH661]|uniref:serine hydrolase domain-containing protein n=1 Tax=Planctomicrobium sp. SH661 TaxID=3448124 RepID=UPI003F5B2EFB